MFGPLPQPLVELVNALTYEPSTASLDAFDEFVIEIESRIEEESDHFVSPRDQMCFEQLGERFEQLLELVEEAPAGASPEYALKVGEAAFAFNRRFLEYQSLRRRTYFVELPELDRLLVVGAAALQGLSDYESVEGRAPKAATSVLALYELFKDRRPLLKAEVCQALVVGFDLLSEGFDLLHHEEQLEAALAKLKAGGDVVSHLVRWERSLMASQVCAVPGVGAELAALVKGETEPGAVKKILPQLEEAWARARKFLFIPVADWDEAVFQVETAMEGLRSGEEPELSVSRLEEAFLWIQQRTLQLKMADESAHRDLAHLLTAAAMGGVPDVMMVHASQQLAAKPEVVESLEEFCRSRNPRPLVEQVERLLREAESEHFSRGETRKGVAETATLGRSLNPKRRAFLDALAGST